MIIYCFSVLTPHYLTWLCYCLTTLHLRQEWFLFPILNRFALLSCTLKPMRTKHQLHFELWNLWIIPIILLLLLPTVACISVSHLTQNYLKRIEIQNDFYYPLCFVSKAKPEKRSATLHILCYCKCPKGCLRQVSCLLVQLDTADRQTNIQTSVHTYFNYNDVSVCKTLCALWLSNVLQVQSYIFHMLSTFKFY